MDAEEEVIELRVENQSLKREVELLRRRVDELVAGITKRREEWQNFQCSP